MKKPVVIVALFLAVALEVGMLYRRDLTRRRGIDAAIADLESSDTVRVNSATQILSQSEDPYAARRLAETLVSLQNSSPARGAVMEAIQKSGERGLSAILDILTADPKTLPEEMRLADERRSRLMSDVTTIVSAMRGEATGVLATLARHATAEARVAAARLLA